MIIKKSSFQVPLYGLALFAVSHVSILAVVEANPQIKEYPVPAGSHPHDVAPASDGTVWYTAQSVGELVQCKLNY